MQLESLQVRGYRSLRNVRIPFGRCTVIVGANGVGKTNIYRSMQLVAAGASGALGRTIAEEGGMGSIRWAGARRKDERGTFIELGFDAIRYALSLALPNPKGFGFPTRFTLDPHVDKESITTTEGKRRIPLLERGGASMLLSRFRFYHHFRTDLSAPMREPRVGTRTPILDHDGADLASAIETIREVGDAEAFRRYVDRGFPGAMVDVDVSDDGRFVVTLATPGLSRPLAARELSDGTLRYLCLVTALCSPHPAPVLVLNEPETSLHPDLLLALVDPVVVACARSQVVVLTHAHALAERTPVLRVELYREEGATVVKAE